MYALVTVGGTQHTLSAAALFEGEVGRTGGIMLLRVDEVNAAVIDVSTLQDVMDWPDSSGRSSMQNQAFLAFSNRFHLKIQC